MPKKYTNEELRKLFQKLPEELQEAIHSDETAEYTWNICDRNNIEQISGLAEKVTNVLIGLLPPNEFQEILEKELGLEKEKAKRVTREVNRFIFYPVRTHLEKLYQIEITPFSTPSSTTETLEKKEKLEKDKYREPLD